MLLTDCTKQAKVVTFILLSFIACAIESVIPEAGGLFKEELKTLAKILAF